MQAKPKQIQIWDQLAREPLQSIFLFESYRIYDLFLLHYLLSQAVFTCSRGDNFHLLGLQTMLHLFWQFWGEVCH